MALLDDCFFCSLSVAASVIGVYTLVAYVIAFSMETWWIVNSSVSLPSPAYILCAGYLIQSFFSVILLRGLSIKYSLYLLEWLLVVAVLFVPEGILVYFMSVHYWNIRSLYGLMELTCWVCRGVINVSGVVCVQSLYSNWREEKAVLRRLRDLNMTRVLPSRRNSVSSQMNGYPKSPVSPPGGPSQLLNNGAFLAPPLRRTDSVVSVVPRPETPMMFLGPVSPPLHPYLSATNEFDACQFDSRLRAQGGPPTPIGKAHSLMDLRQTGSVLGPIAPRKTLSVVDFPLEKNAHEKPPPQTQSLDRRVLKQHYWRVPAQVEGVYVSNRLKNAYFPPLQNGDFVMNPSFTYGRNVNSFYPGKPTFRSKHSLGSESDDLHKYRDIAL